MARQPKRTAKSTPKPASATSRPGVVPMTAEAIAKQLKLKSAHQAEKWCEENGIPAFTREEWKAAYDSDPGGSAKARYYHPGMVTALIEDQIIAEEKAKEPVSDQPFDDDGDNY